MHLTLIRNPNESKIIQYKIARIIYAETNASSLIAVEALAAMIKNLCVTCRRDLTDIVTDCEIFESINQNSIRHSLLAVDVKNRGFEMCLRVVARMIRGDLPDVCNGATRFHRDDVMPKWAMSRGYVAEIDGLFFYL